MREFLEDIVPKITENVTITIRDKRYFIVLITVIKNYNVKQRNSFKEKKKRSNINQFISL